MPPVSPASSGHAPLAEVDRLATLRALQILDTPAEARFDRLTRLAQALFDAPVAMIAFVDEQRVWAKSCRGAEAAALPPEGLCREAIAHPEGLVLTDLAAHPRHRRDPLAAEPWGMRFFAAHPVRALNGAALGAIAILDRAPRRFSAADRRALADLAAIVETELNASRLGQALAMQRESQSRVRAIMDAVADGIFTFDEWGLLESFNPAAERLFGYAESEALGLNVAMLFPPSSQRARTGPLSLLVRHVPIGMSQERQGRHRDGAVFPMELTIGELALGDRRLYIAACRDITARKLAEEELRRHALALERANAHLQELDRLKSDFINTASHELRTPLTSVVGYAEFLEDEIAGPLSPDQRTFVGQIQEAARRLSRLVGDLLDFARMEAGTFRLVRQEAELAPLVREALASLRPQAREAALALEAHLPDAPIFVRVDPQRLGQVLLNLVGNALKFTPGGGAVTVTVAPEGETVKVSVQDTGIGIPAAHLERLFEKFYQVDPSLTREQSGAGLGLSIARSLVEAHGGAIGVESREGHGATFWFTLPAYQRTH